MRILLGLKDLEDMPGFEKEIESAREEGVEEEGLKRGKEEAYNEITEYIDNLQARLCQEFAQKLKKG